MSNEITNAERFNLGFDAVQYAWFGDLESDLSCMRTLPEAMWPVRNVHWQSEKELAYIAAVAPPGIPFNLSRYIEPSKSGEAGIKKDNTSMDCWRRIENEAKKVFYLIEENAREICPDNLIAIHNNIPIIETYKADEFVGEVKKHKDKQLLVSRFSPRELRLESAGDYSEYARFLYNHYKANTDIDVKCWLKNEWILRICYPRHFIAIHKGDVAIIEKNHKKFIKEVETRYYGEPLLHVYASKEKIDLDNIVVDDE